MFKPLIAVTYVLAFTCAPVTTLSMTMPLADATANVLLFVIAAVVVVDVIVLSPKSSIDSYGLYLATDILSSLL